MGRRLARCHHGRVPAASARRPLKTRQRRWAGRIAGWLKRRGVPPNVISVASVVAAAAAAAALLLLPGEAERGQAILLVFAGVFIQLRLLANMLDGLVAIEGGLHSSSGDLFNEVPDRVDDVVILAAAGYAIPALAWAPALGWLAAVLALLTAYIRVLGGSLGAPQTFAGPMAKPHRMFILTVAC